MARWVQLKRHALGFSDSRLLTCVCVGSFKGDWINAFECGVDLFALRMRISTSRT